MSGLARFGFAERWNHALPFEGSRDDCVRSAVGAVAVRECARRDSSPARLSFVGPPARPLGGWLWVGFRCLPCVSGLASSCARRPRRARLASRRAALGFRFP